MKGAQGFIQIAEMEIAHLKQDLDKVTNDISYMILENAIENRQNSIKKIKEKYVNS